MHLTALILQYNFRCKTHLAKYDHWCLICEGSPCTM